MPVSSLSSRSAASYGDSSGPTIPAGSSMVSLSNVGRYCLTKTKRPSSVMGRIPTESGATIPKYGSSMAPVFESFEIASTENHSQFQTVDLIEAMAPTAF